MRPPSYVCELSTDVDPIKYQVPATLHCPHYIAVSFNVIINTHMFLKLSTCLIVETLLIVNCASILHCSSNRLTLVGVCASGSGLLHCYNARFHNKEPSSGFRVGRTHSLVISKLQFLSQFFQNPLYTFLFRVLKFLIFNF